MSKKDKAILSSTQNATPIGRNSLISFDDLDHWFDDCFSRRWPRAFDWQSPFSEKAMSISGTFPNVDIIDHANEIEIQAALPGVRKEDLDVSISESSVTIRATTQREDKKEAEHYYRREISRGEFQRTLALPAHVNGDQAKASFKDGMLNITLPNMENSKRKSIEIK